MSLHNIRSKAMWVKYNNLYGKFIKTHRKKSQYFRNAAGNRWVKIADRLEEPESTNILYSIYEFKYRRIPAEQILKTGDAQGTEAGKQ